VVLNLAKKAHDSLGHIKLLNQTGQFFAWWWTELDWT